MAPTRDSDTNLRCAPPALQSDEFEQASTDDDLEQDITLDDLDRPFDDIELAVTLDDPGQAITLDEPDDSPGIGARSRTSSDRDIPSPDSASGTTDDASPSESAPPSVEPIAWLADIDSPESALPDWVLARIDRTAERYRDRWTPEQTAAFRRHMAWTLATHPRVRKVVDLVESPLRH